MTVSARPNVSIVDDNIKNASGDTVTAGISRQLRSDLALHVDGVYTNLRNFARTQNINQAVPAFDFKTLTAAQAATISSFSAAQINARRPLANWGNVTELASNGWSDYRALYVRLDKRFANGYQYLLSYTRDWTENNVTTSPTTTIRTSRRGRRGASTRSSRAATRGCRSSITAGRRLDDPDGAAVRRQSGVDLTGDGTVDRVPGVTRNMAGRDSKGTAQLLELVNAWRAVRGSGGDSREPDREQRLQPGRHARQPDVRAAIGDHVEVLAQFFNLFGRDNLIGGTGGAFVNNALSNSFGRYTVAGARQEMELGIRFRF